MTPSDNQSTDDNARALLMAVVGAVMLIAMFLMTDHLAGLARDHGRVLVYFGFFLWASIAGRVFWSGADPLIEKLRKSRA